MFAPTLMDIHAAKWPSAARIASDLVISFLAAASSRASSRRSSGARLLGGQPYGHDLHRFSPPTRATSTTTLQSVDVVTGVGLGGAVLHLLVAHHGNSV